MKDASKALDCIGCMCCYSACPVIGLGDLTDFAGPAPLVQLGQTALDPRNEPGKGRALAGAHRHIQLRLLLQMRGSVPGCNSDRQPHHRAAESKSGASCCPSRAAIRARCGDIVAARGRVDPGALVLQRAGSARAGQTAAHRPPVAARQDQPAANIVRHQNRGCGARAPPASAGRPRNEICILSRLLGAQHLRRA